MSHVGGRTRKKYVLRVTSVNAFGGKTIRHWTIPEAMEEGWIPVPFSGLAGLPGHMREFTVPPIPDYYETIQSVTVVEHTLDDTPPQGYSERVETMREGFRAFLRHEIPLEDLVEMFASE